MLRTDRVHTDFEAAFTDSAGFRSRSGHRYSIRVRPIGSLSVPTGALAVGYPYVPDHAQRLARIVPPGRYPSELAVAVHDGSEEPAAVRLRLSSASAVTWEPALSTTGVFGTDIGGRARGAIADVGTFADLDVKVRLGPGNWRYPNTEALEQQLQGNVARCLALPTGAELAVFSTAMGGNYASYWGFEQAGEVSELVVDLMALVENTDAGLGRMARVG